MGRLLPAGFGGTSATEARPRVIGIDGEEADDLLAAMSSGTARELLASLHEEPAAPSELADRVGTSLQNAQYHLGKLEAAGAVEVADTVYSEKGREMKLYAPADRPLVVVAGGADETSSLRSAIATLLAGVGVVGLLAVLVQTLAGREPTQADGADVMMSAESTTPVAGAAGGFDPAALLTEPGVLFFLGGAAALLIAAAVAYVRR
ncbi:MAG: winged helix-turn-helix domain-containing protein [Halobacteriales archaeon]|nr:winged helix-turn-helix domain-containing protein [Halobacteriales archaeon]